MITLELTQDEEEMLGQVLQHSLATLELEIQHTDHKEFKALLRHRRDVLKGLADRLRRSVVGAL